MLDKSNSVFIDYCVNCSNHFWCTKHSEERYNHFFQSVKAEIQKEFPTYNIYGNTRQRNGKLYSPTLGAFEVTFRDRLIFSKLQTGSWPTPNLISQRICAVLDGRDFNDANTISQDKPVKQVHTGLPPKNRRFNNLSYHEVGNEQRSLLNNSALDENTGGGSFHETSSLPQIKQAVKKRDITPARLEGTGGFSYVDRDQASRPHVNLAYLDPQKRVVKGVREYQPVYFLNQFQMGAYRHQEQNNEEFAPDYQQTGQMKTTVTHQQTINLPNPHSRAQIADDSFSPEKLPSNHRRNISGQYEGYANKEERGNPYEPRGYPTTTYQKPSYGYISTMDPENEAADMTVFSNKSKYTDNDPYRGEKHIIQQPKNKLVKGPSGTYDEQPSQDNLSQPHSQSNVSSMKKMASNLDMDDNNKTIDYDNYKEKHVINQMYPQAEKKWNVGAGIQLRGAFPEQKASEIRVGRNKVVRKKITMTADDDMDCKVGVFSNEPNIIGLDFNEMKIPKGTAFKIPLKFEHRDDVERMLYNIFVFKNDQPWQKIMIDAQYE